MTEILPVVLAVCLVIITIILAVVGIQIIMVLMEVRRTMKKVNDVVDEAEAKVNQVLAPLQNLGGMAAGIQTGVKVMEKFVDWLSKKKEAKVVETKK